MIREANRKRRDRGSGTGRVSFLEAGLLRVSVLLLLLTLIFQTFPKQKRISLNCRKD